MRNESIETFIANLHDASGFEIRTTAVDGWPVDQPEPADVDAWIREAWTHCLRRYLAYPNDPPFGAAVIEDRDRGRVYEQSPCETGEWFLERVATETRAAAEPWMLVQLPAVPGVERQMWQSWAPGRDPLPCTFTWYFEARGRGQATRLWGHAQIDVRVAALWSQDGLEPPRAYAAVLRGHPARRRHPIRSPQRRLGEAR